MKEPSISEIKRESKKNSKPDFFLKYIPKYYFKKYKTWLDCASGDGYMFADFWIDKYISPKRYICIDKNEKLLKRLEEKECVIHCVDLETTDIKTLLKKESIDMIVSLETFEHLNEKTANSLMESFIFILRENGMICLTFPIAVDLNNDINKHQPNINLYIEYKKYFKSFKHYEWKKSHVLFFNEKI